MIREKHIKQIAEILVHDRGKDSAIEYCKTKVDEYEKRNEELKFDRRLNEVASNKIMIEFYLAVSLMIRNE